MTSPYKADIPAIPVGRFRSKLEYHWHCIFEAFAWPNDYIGDRVAYADFFVKYDAPKGFILEVKPKQDFRESSVESPRYSVENDSFLQAAVDRFKEHGIKKAMLAWGEDQFVWYSDSRLFGPIPVLEIMQTSVLSCAIDFHAKGHSRLPLLPDPLVSVFESCREWINFLGSDRSWREPSSDIAFRILHNLIKDTNQGVFSSDSLITTKQEVISQLKGKGCPSLLDSYVKQNCSLGDGHSVPVSWLHRDFNDWFQKHPRYLTLSPFQGHTLRQDVLRKALRTIGVRSGTETLPLGSSRSVFRGIKLLAQD